MKKSRNEILKEERKQRIIDVALELFSNQGYHAVSVSMIAKAAGMSKGLMYNYFDSKEDLLGVILEDHTKNISRQLDITQDGVLTTDDFEHFVRTVYRMVKENTTYYKLIFSLSFHEGIAVKLHEVVADVMPLNYELLQSYFKSLGRQDVEAEILMFASVIKGFFLQLVLIPDFEDLLPAYAQQFDKLVDRIVEDYT